VAILTLSQAIESAEALSRNVRPASDAAAYEALEQSLRAFANEGYPVESIIPHGTEATLGFSLRTVDGRTFFEVYGTLLRRKLCTEDGEFSKLMRSGVNSSVGAILTAIVAALGIPVAALGVMVPVAVIIANTGLDAFCEITKA
jgi:hypothetical protein